MPLTSKDPPVLRYLGGKHAIADWIIEKFPPHLRYVELFAGGASVALRKQPAQMTVINDLDGEVVNFFRVLRETPDALARAIDLTPYSRAEYLLSYNPTAEPLERARRLYVRLWQGFTQRKTKAAWRVHKNSNGQIGSDIEHWQRLDHLIETAKILKGVYVENQDALLVFKRYDETDTLFYVDPPYCHEKRRDLNGGHYPNEMTNEEHEALLAALVQAKGYVVISGYANELYNRYLADWRRFDKEVTTNGNARATESLWVSPNATAIEALPLFAKRD